MRKQVFVIFGNCKWARRISSCEYASAACGLTKLRFILVMWVTDLRVVSHTNMKNMWVP